MEQWNRMILGQQHHLENTCWYNHLDLTHNQVRDWFNREAKRFIAEEQKREEFSNNNPELDDFLNNYKRKEG